MSSWNSLSFLLFYFLFLTYYFINWQLSPELVIACDLFCYCEINKREKKKQFKHFIFFFDVRIEKNYLTIFMCKSSQQQNFVVYSNCVCVFFILLLLIFVHVMNSTRSALTCWYSFLHLALFFFFYFSSVITRIHSFISFRCFRLPSSSFATTNSKNVCFFFVRIFLFLISVSFAVLLSVTRLIYRQSVTNKFKRIHQTTCWIWSVIAYSSSIFCCFLFT